MTSELKEQNHLLKNEKNDLNRLIQEQSQQWTGKAKLCKNLVVLLGIEFFFLFFFNVSCLQHIGFQKNNTK